MDASAMSLMRDNGIPIVVFSIGARGGLADVLHGRGVCTTITTRGRTSWQLRAPFKLDDYKKRMDGAITALGHEFGGLRTGRASPALLDPIMVEAYGASSPLTSGRQRQRARAAHDISQRVG
jgi:hypothetical protein